MKISELEEQLGHLELLHGDVEVRVNAGTDVGRVTDDQKIVKVAHKRLVAYTSRHTAGEYIIIEGDEE